jgi:outer membrane protein OmpA-like peptidoglycan-associated protein
LAQGRAVPSFQLERLQLNTGGGPSLLIGTGELLPEEGFRFSFAGEYEHRPLLYYPDQGASIAVVRSRVASRLAGAYSPLSWLELGVAVPIIAYQSADDLSALGLRSASSAGLGSPLLTGRFQLATTSNGAPVDLATQLGVSIPVGSSQALARDSGAALIPKLMAGRTVGPIRAGMELGAWIGPKTSLSGSSIAKDEVGSELQAGGTVVLLGTRATGELSARGAIPFTRQPGGLEILGGGRYLLNSSLELFALAGPGFGTSPGIPAFRVVCGLGLRHAAAAPMPRLAMQEPSENRCVAGKPHTPAECPDLDDDGDGIPNKLDQCPTQAGTLKNRGCPFPDQDGDGVEDSADACPTQPGPAATHGCPDADGDGIPDHLDNCPHDKGPADNQGCPTPNKQLVVITPDKLIIKEKVHFASGLARLLPDSSKLLDQIANVLVEHPSLALISIEGHTDNRGSGALNQALSQGRAQSVYDYLITSGVDARRLRVKGYGPDHPISTNKTPQGREANRRVEFVIPR